MLLDPLGVLVSVIFNQVRKRISSKKNRSNASHPLVANCFEHVAYVVKARGEQAHARHRVARAVRVARNAAGGPGVSLQARAQSGPEITQTTTSAVLVLWMTKRGARIDTKKGESVVFSRRGLDAGLHDAPVHHRLFGRKVNSAATASAMKNPGGCVVLLLRLYEGL